MITIFKGSYRARSDKGKAVKLTRIEFDLLMLLASARGSVVSIKSLEAKSHIKTNNAASSRPAVSHLCRLRKKLGASELEAIRGVGYRLTSPAIVSDGIE